MKILRTVPPTIAVIIFFFATTAQAASLFWVPENGEFGIGSKITTSLKIESEGVGINAAQATIRFPKETLQVESIDKTGSAFSFWLEDPTFSNTEGVISFVGGTPYGVSGASIEVIKITFSTKGSGVAPVSITDGAITASDGTGTNVLAKTNDATFTVSPTKVTTPTAVVLPPTQITREAVPGVATPAKPIVTVSLYPNSSEWYNASNIFTASWSLPRDITAVSTALNKQPNFSPSQSEGLFDNKSFEALTDGVWYLHVRLRNDLGWGETTHYRLGVDTKAPLPFEITSLENESTDNPTPTLAWKTSDALSGVNEYHIRIDAKDWIIISGKDFKGSYKLPVQNPGKHAVTIKAIDGARNSIENIINIETIPLPLPALTFVTEQIFSDEQKGLTLKGTGIPETEILVTINRGEVLIKDDIVMVDTQGNWEFTFSDPLRNGTYLATIQNRDSRGALSIPVISNPIKVSEKPIFQLGPISLGKNGVIFALFIILLAGFTAGYFFYKTRRARTALRLDLASSDLTKVFKMIENDVNSLDKARATPTPADDEFVAQKLKANIQKMGSYLKKEINKAKE